MKKSLALIIVALLPACASFEQPANFALNAYPGETSLEKTLNQVNLEANRALPCPLRRLRR